jgi:hypothetical protein
MSSSGIRRRSPRTTSPSKFSSLASLITEQPLRLGSSQQHRVKIALWSSQRERPRRVPRAAGRPPRAAQNQRLSWRIALPSVEADPSLLYYLISRIVDRVSEGQTTATGALNRRNERRDQGAREGLRSRSRFRHSPIRSYSAGSNGGAHGSKAASAGITPSCTKHQSMR